MSEGEGRGWVIRRLWLTGIHRYAVSRFSRSSPFTVSYAVFTRANEPCSPVNPCYDVGRTIKLLTTATTFGGS